MFVLCQTFSSLFLAPFYLTMEAPKTVEIELNEVDMEEKKDKQVTADDLAYAIEDVPPWYLCIFLGFQVRFDFLLR